MKTIRVRTLLSVLLVGGAVQPIIGLTQQSAGVAAEFNAANIKRGKHFYSMHCANCHGADGRGDTEMREFLKTAPADLSDAEWVYGGSDAEVFDVIKSGRTNKDMPAFAEQLTDEEIGQVMSYLAYLGGRKP